MPKSLLLAYAMVPVLYGISALVIPGFASWPSLTSMLVIASFLGLASVGQTLTILLGGIDLSIPAVIGLANVLTVRWYGAGLPFGFVILAVLALATAIGALSGWLSRLLRAHPLLVTLGMGFVIQGCVLVYTEGVTVGTVPDALQDAVSPAGATGPIPLPPIVLIWLWMSALVVLVEQRSILGRYLFLTGANEKAAQLALIPVRSVWIGAFALSGLFAGMTGILLAGFSGAADAGVGQPYLFQTVAAVVVGGTALLGGQGSYLRTLAGALLITEITTFLIGVGFDDRAQQIMLGVLIVALVAIYGREPPLRAQV